MSLFYKKCEICGHKIKKRVKIFSPRLEIECENCKTVYEIKQPLILKILISILDEVMFIILLICGAYLALYIDENFYQLDGGIFFSAFIGIFFILMLIFALIVGILSSLILPLISKFTIKKDNTNKNLKTLFGKFIKFLFAKIRNKNN